MKKVYPSLIGHKTAVVKILVFGILGIFSISNTFSQTYATVPFVDGFETGTIGPSWTTYSSLEPGNGGNLVVTSGTLTWSTQTAYSHTGTYFLGMHYPTGGSYNLNQCNLHMNLLGETNIRLDFWWAEWNDETEVQDGIYVSDNNGGTFVKVLDLNGTSYTDLVYTHFDLSLDSINTVHGLSFSSQYIIRFQQYDNYYFAGGNDGFLFDDISVYEACNSGSTISESVCSSYTTPSGNQTYTQSGTYVDTIPNSAGCDSLITINLLVNNTQSNIVEQACTSYTAPDGMVYTSTGIYTAVIPNAAGCDSTITIDLEVLQTTSSSIVEEACGSYTSPDGMVYSNSGLYTAVIQNSQGCDSTISIDLTVNPITTTNISENICSGSDYTAPDGMVYSATGVYTAVIQSSAGCDSTIVIDLTVNTATSSSISETALDSYTVPSGDETYTISGIYLDTIPNVNGCDSVITIDLTMQYTGIQQVVISVVSIYPNPTSGPIQFDGIEKLTGIKSIELVDSRGRLVETLSSDATNVNIEGVQVGNYTLIIRHDRGIERLPIVKR